MNKHKLSFLAQSLTNTKDDYAETNGKSLNDSAKNKHKLSFWAQSLTNTKDDHAETDGKSLNDSANREKLAEEISSVTLNKRSKKIEEGNITIFYTESHFVLKVIFSQVDNLGRKAPIICYGKIVSLDYHKECVKSLKDFMRKAKREDPSDKEEQLLEEFIEKSYNRIKDENAPNKKKRLALMLGASGTVGSIMIKAPVVVTLVPLLLATGYIVFKKDDLK